MHNMDMDVEHLIYRIPKHALAKRMWERVSIPLCSVLFVICIVLTVLYLKANSKTIEHNEIAKAQTANSNSKNRPSPTILSKNRTDNSKNRPSPTIPSKIRTDNSKNRPSPTTPSKNNWTDICQDTGNLECILAKEMVHNMDLNVDPCKDFYKYSCGGWERRHPLTGNKTSIRQLFLLQKKNLAILKKALEKSSLNYSQNVAVMKTARVYRSCVNTSAMSSQGLQPMKNLIAKYGGWSVSYNYNSTMSMETRMGRVARDLNVNTLFGVTVRPDLFDSSRTIIMLLPAETQSHSLYLDFDDDSVKQRENYKKIMKMVGRWFGGSDSSQKMMAIYEFEANLARIAIGKDPETTMRESFLRSSRSSSPLPDFTITLDKFCYYISPGGSSSYFVCNFLKGILQTVVGRPFTGSEQLMDGLPTYKLYFKRLYEFYQKYEDNQQIIADYITWRVVYHYLLYLPPKYSSEVTAILGFPSVPRWMWCIETMMRSLDMPLGLMYVDANFNVNSRTNVEKMTDNIRLSFIERLPKQTWMDRETQRKAKQKARAIKISIGYPDYIKDAKKLERQYDSFKVHDDYFENTKEMNHFLRMRNVMTYGKPVDKNSWPISPAEVNGFYIPLQNRIVYLAGIIQPPLFNPRSPSYLNYGGIGSVIGHELTHGFDASGRLYDKNGNMKDWWSYEADINFKRKSSCLVDQYNKYKLFDKQVNGKKTLNENIADDGGIKIAYDAYQKWIAKNKKEESLPGLNLNPDQLFFVGFAQLWCSVYNRKGAHREILKDVHTPGKYRVIGSLSNFDKFSKAFKCPVGSPMNPSTKCSVW